MMDLWATVPYYTAYLSKALIAQGADLRVGSISYYLDPACFSSRGIVLRPGLLDLVGRYRLPRLPRRILKLAEALLNMAALAVQFLFSPPAIVHIQYLPMLRWRPPLDLWFLSLCRMRGSRLLLTVHDLLPHNTGQEYRQIFEDLYARMDGIICHSDHVKARLQTEFGISGERIRVIPHGPFFYDLPASVDALLRDRLHIPADAPLVLWQGILSPYKGLDLLLEAWQHVEQATGVGWLLVVGTGAPELLAEMREKANSLGLARLTLNLSFVSPEELVAAYRAADVVVYPYRAITTSGALATGLALGKAIVASDLPVFREMLVDGQDALLVAPGDVDALAGAILRLLQDSSLRERLVQAVTAMQFGDRSWMSIARETMLFYEQLAAARVVSQDAKTAERHGEG
jgi:glycosyltransferase involved in cell wall biosynthesis